MLSKDDPLIALQDVAIDGMVWWLNYSFICVESRETSKVVFEVRWMKFRASLSVPLPVFIHWFGDFLSWGPHDWTGSWLR